MSIPRRYPRLSLALLLALALLAPLFALAPPSLAADPCMVTSGADSGAGTLRAAVDTVANGGCAGGTVTFAAGVAEVRLSSLLRIDRALTIQGPGVAALTLRYTGASSVSGNVVTITAGPTILRDLTIADGKVASSYYGGGVRIAPSAAQVVVATLERVRVAGNQAVGNGGGLFATNATLQITDSIFEGNQAGQSGGGLYLSDSIGPVTATLTGTIVGTSANPNKATGAPDYGLGGGIYNSKATLKLSRSTVSGNTAYAGAGIYNRGTVTLTDSTVSGNTAEGGGVGGVTSDHGALTLVGSTISGNKATSGHRGGGLEIYYGTADLTNVTISGNSATGNGGGLVLDGTATVTLKFATVVGNVADTGHSGSYAGGGIYNSATLGATLTVLSSIVAGNTTGAGISNDCSGTIASQGRNLWGDHSACPNDNIDGDQNLATLNVPIGAVLDPTLADNGGPLPVPHTLTHALVPGSPAIDHGDNVTCAATPPGGAGGVDQRGAPRTDGHCDTGAIEYTTPPPSPSPSPSANPSPSPSPCGTRFADVPASDPACVAIEALAGRGVINGCDSSASPPLFCPNDPTLRHQMAALIVRAIPAWAAETGLPTFTDNTADTELMTRVATLQRHGVVRGYQDEVCVSQGKTTPCYGPLDTVKYGQVLLFIARALVADNIWALQPDDRTIFPDQNGAAGADPNTDQQTLDHRMIVTYVHYVGAPPDVADVHAPFLRAGVAAGGWGDASTRAWFARAFWPAIQGH